MARHRSNPKVDSQQYLGVHGGDTEGKNDVQELFRGVGERQDTYSLPEGGIRTAGASDVAPEPADHLWEEIAGTMETVPTPQETTEDEIEDEEPGLGSESLEMLEDPVRMYLHEIGRTRLLTFKEEREPWKANA